MSKQGSRKQVTVSEPRRGLSAQVAINSELGSLRDCSLLELPERDWNAPAIYHLPEEQTGCAHNWATILRAEVAPEKTRK